MTQSTMTHKGIPVAGTRRRADQDQAVTAGPNTPSNLDAVPAGWEQLVSSCDFVVPEAAMADLKAGSKDAVIAALVDALVRAGVLAPHARAELISAVVQREELASTGIGQGIAIPHAKHASVSRVVGALAYCPDGVEFASLDGRPVHLVLLLVSPPSASRDHLLALEAASRRLSEPPYAAWRTGTAPPPAAQDSQ